MRSKWLHSCNSWSTLFSHFIFRTGPHCCKYYSTKRPLTNQLLKYLRSKIEATGPITIAEYMKEVLTNQFSGYYMHKDVFGSHGDFITSPEISQMFGELIAVWFYNEWSKIGQPQPLQLVEFGPGRGTLADDILRVFAQLNVDKKKFSLHFVEISPYLCKLQKTKLCPKNEVEKQCSGLQSEDNNELYCKPSFTKYGFPVTWHYHLKSVPENFSLFLAHEFFDALPIHKFKKVLEGWREILIDYRESSSQLQYVLSRGPTPASKMFIDPKEKRTEMEISLESGILIDQLTTRMKEDGGLSLIVDYGHTGLKTDTFRSFRGHELHDPLVDPGNADLTADVDFSYLIKHSKDKAVYLGPVTQGTFLKNMAIDIRLEKLLQRASAEEQKSLKSGYNMLMDQNQMGERYKFLALFPNVLKDFLSKYPPAGFS